jgi:type IV pilus assembly protein PilM
MSSLFARLFPVPSFFTIPTVGLDFSDATMRFMELKDSRQGILPKSFTELAIPDGCMQNGRIGDEAKFIAFLKAVRTKHALKYVRISIPESQVYAITLSIDAAVKDDIRSSIELLLEDNIPLKAIETIFDYQVLSSTEKTIVVQVVALSEAVAQGYLSAFTAAGLVPVSFELDGQAIARALLRPEDKRSCMIVDFGAHYTGITIVTNGVAVYTSTLDFGGKSLAALLMKELNIDEGAAHKLIHQYGVSTTGEHKNIFTILAGGISVLKDEIDRRYVYWHEKKDQFRSVPAIDTVYVCGGYSTIPGLIEYLSASLKLPVTQANPWINCLSFDQDIPALMHDEAQSYVTAIGLALTDFIYD